MRELSTLQAAGAGAPVLAGAALLSLALSVWAIWRTREGSLPRFAFRVAFIGGLVLCAFFALTLSAHAASRAGVRATVAAEHQTVLLLDLLDRATMQLTRGRALLKVASVLLWPPLLANTLALVRSSVRGSETGLSGSAKVAGLVMTGVLALGTLKVLTSGRGDPRDEAYSIVVPPLLAELRSELVPGAQEPTCARLEGAVAIMGAEKVNAELTAARDVARACAERRLREGTSKEALAASPLLQLAPNALDGKP